jgi:ribonuclease Z
MLPFNVTILGNGSAVPTSFQHPTSQLVTYGSKRFMIDCGEGTQMQMIKYKTGHKHIDHIFISHLHGDHFFGLIGIINTFHLFGRKNPLHIYAPAAVKKVIDVQLGVSLTTLRYPLVYHALEDMNNKPLYEDKNLIVSCFPLNHRIPAFGFVFKEKASDRKLKKSFVSEFNPSIEQIHAVKSGLDYETETGMLISNREITDDPLPPRSYAFCSDTAYFEAIIPYIRNVNLLYHEATFDNSQENMAADKFHSTAAQAATIAQKATVKKLLLGHFSARFKEKNHLLQEAKAVFSNTELSVEGRSYDI